MNRLKIYAGIAAAAAAVGGLGLTGVASAAPIGHGHNGGWSYSYRFQGSGRGHISRDGSSLNYRISSSRSRATVTQSNAGYCDVNISLIDSPDANINVAQNCLLTVTSSG